MSAETVTRIAAFLDAHHVMSLATSGRHGPHAANLFYVRDGFALLWVSDPNSRHSVDIADNGCVAATIAPDCLNIDDIRGVQISGRAHVITGEALRADARRLFEARYPQVKRSFAADSALGQAYAEMGFYRLEPARMVLIDNSRGFAHKETIELENFKTDQLHKLSSTTSNQVDSPSNAKASVTP